MRRKLDEAYAQQRQDGAVDAAVQRFGAMNLEEFYQATGGELTLVAADISGERLLVLNHRTAPRCPVFWATTMSMSVPLLWQEVVWQPEWGSYRGLPISGHAMVDGGLVSNVPLELFLSDYEAGH